MRDLCGKPFRSTELDQTPKRCRRPAGHEGICWPVSFESDKSSEEPHRVTTYDDIDKTLAAEEHQQGMPVGGDPDHCDRCWDAVIDRRGKA